MDFCYWPPEDQQWRGLLQKRCGPAPKNTNSETVGSKESVSGGSRKLRDAQKGENLRRFQRIKKNLMIVFVQENIGSGAAGGRALRGNTTS